MDLILIPWLPEGHELGMAFAEGNPSRHRCLNLRRRYRKSSNADRTACSC